MEILLATGNTHKKKEMQQILTEHKIIIPADLSINFDPEENGKTYFENAFIKADTLFRLTGKPVISDDSGLAVDALDGGPGIYSARYGNDRFKKVLTSAERNDYLLSVLEGEKTRTARFVCCLIFLEDTCKFRAVQETVEGLISLSPDGKEGFGYDPVFYVPEFECTMARLSEQDKNRISHRGKAALKLKTILENI